MVLVSDLKTVLATSPTAEYQCDATLNLYDSPALECLATQAVAGRQLRILTLPSSVHEKPDLALQVRLREDDYPGWIAVEDLDLLSPAEFPYQPRMLSETEIGDRLPQVIRYAMAAMNQPNHYLWGGSVGPNYDCSGLVQAAFVTAGIWLPRDSYQQEAFTRPVAETALKPGDLVFFGSHQRTTHVGIYLGDQCYIHSSGKDQGRNGIGIDRLSQSGDAVSQAYYRQFRRGGRVYTSYQPQL
jgi:hypothetical protein